MPVYHFLTPIWQHHIPISKPWGIASTDPTLRKLTLLALPLSTEPRPLLSGLSTWTFSLNHQIGPLQPPPGLSTPPLAPHSLSKSEWLCLHSHSRLPKAKHSLMTQSAYTTLVVAQTTRPHLAKHILPQRLVPLSFDNLSVQLYSVTCHTSWLPVNQSLNFFASAKEWQACDAQTSILVSHYRRQNPFPLTPLKGCLNTSWLPPNHSLFTLTDVQH